ncbi:hypothetical protein GS534_24225 [Rhodococcus hoagii]|nr:hypothetical protein [Prescottella equi]
MKEAEEHRIRIPVGRIIDTAETTVSAEGFVNHPGRLVTEVVYGEAQRRDGMKVKIEVTVDIDPEAWTMNYGVEGAAAIREDVREYCRNTLIEQLRQVAVWKES